MVLSATINISTFFSVLTERLVRLFGITFLSENGEYERRLIGAEKR